MTQGRRTFSMHIPEATLVFEPGEDAYKVYATEPSDSFDWSRWASLRESLTPTGQVSLTDVEFNEASGFTVHTMGIERFAVLP